MRTIKALSIWQPWASLFVDGRKEYETRSWDTRHRGWLAIHAAKSTQGRRFGHESFGTWCIHSVGFDGFDDLPRGYVLGFVYIDAVWQLIRDDHQSDPVEALLGDWSAGRYAWHAQPESRVVLEEPIPARGRQGLWTWQMPDSIELLKGKL